MTIDLSDFDAHPLSPKIWDNQDLRPAVREQMLKAAREFIDEYNIPMEAVRDITFTGSMAGYYWGQYSDIDLHILVDFPSLGKDPELLRDYYDLAKVVWGKNRPQYVCGHEVELYVQSTDQPHFAAAVYSVLNDKWINEPRNMGNAEVDADYVLYKMKYLSREIKQAAHMVTRDPEAAMTYLEQLKDRIKRMRQEGLEQGGEMHPNNIAYKVMRREGIMETLRQLYKLAYSNYTSLEC